MARSLSAWVRIGAVIVWVRAGDKATGPRGGGNEVQVRQVWASVMVMIGLASPLWPEGQRLSEGELRQALSGLTLRYESGSVQTFYPSGRTSYEGGEVSWGSWTLRDGQYCSQWPPSATWDCYDVQSDGISIRFIGAAGDVTVGRPVE